MDWSIAVCAGAAYFDHRTCGREARGAGGSPYVSGNAVIVDVRGLSAVVADKEDTVVDAARMAVGDERIGALDAADQVICDEKVKDSIDAVWCNAFATRLRDRIGNVISAGRLVPIGYGAENVRAHIGPQFTSGFQCSPCSGFEFRTDFMMVMRDHAINVAPQQRNSKGRQC